MSGCGAPLVNLLATCVMLFLGALGGGTIPLLVGPTRSKADLVSGVAAGFLVGSVLGVIVPEGFEALRSEIDTEGNTHDGHHHHEHHHHSDWMIGASMVGGFMLMLILDSLSGSHSHADIVPDEHRRGKEVGHLLFGLVIHSIADGLAVGVAALAPDGCIGLLVGIAMVLHKGPVAFGFTAYLLTLRRPIEKIRAELLIFAVASPIAALLIYGVHELMPPFLGSTNIGYLLLFSAGTFLYVACSHIVPDLLHSHNGPISNQSILAICSGGVIPLLLTSWLGHGH
ncbi:hypothetical protein BSKO_00350 [Bryopsis sp. KO-2023]|nr:hypothetical protein BSKO_00350 [Bryopsis sp. KO-2023]